MHWQHIKANFNYYTAVTSALTPTQLNLMKREVNQPEAVTVHSGGGWAVVVQLGWGCLFIPMCRKQMALQCLLFSTLLLKKGLSSFGTACRCSPCRACHGFTKSKKLGLIYNFAPSFLGTGLCFKAPRPSTFSYLLSFCPGTSPAKIRSLALNRNKRQFWFSASSPTMSLVETTQRQWSLSGGTVKEQPPLQSQETSLKVYVYKIYIVNPRCKVLTEREENKLGREFHPNEWNL